MIATACFALLAAGILCINDPDAHSGSTRPRWVWLECVSPPDRAAALRVPVCGNDQPPEQP